MKLIKTKNGNVDYTYCVIFCEGNVFSFAYYGIDNGYMRTPVAQEYPEVNMYTSLMGLELGICKTPKAAVKNAKEEITKYLELSRLSLTERGTAK